jgi:iron complex transport system substrate-binding protein
VSSAVHPAARFSGPAALKAPARRILSLLPSSTEIVAALGLGDRLVGVTHECDWPPEVVAPLPRLTADRLAGRPRTAGEIDAAVRAALADGHGLYALDEAALASLDPDLILTQELCAVCAVSYPVVVEAARAAGGDDVPLVVSLEPESLEDVLRTIELVAALAGIAERGVALVSALRQRLDAAPIGVESRRVAVVEWLDPLFAPGHWVPEQVACAGGISVFGQPRTRSVQASWKALAAAEPEVVVLGLCGYDLAATLHEWRAFDIPDALRATEAWRTGEIWAVDGSAYVSRPGPRLVDGVELFRSILSGQPDQRAVRLT